MDWLEPNPFKGLPVDASRAAFQYDLKAARRMVDRSARFMAKDLKRALGRGYQVDVKEVGDAIPSRSWLWNIRTTLTVSRPDGSTRDVTVQLNIAEGESSGWFKIGSSSIVSAPRDESADQEWELIRNEIAWQLKT